MMDSRISAENQVRAVDFLSRVGNLSHDNQTYIFGMLNGILMSAGLPDKPAPKKRGRKPKTETDGVAK